MARLNTCTPDADYIDNPTKIRIVKDADNEYPWQVDGIKYNRAGEIDGHTEYVSNWRTWESATTLGIRDFCIERPQVCLSHLMGRA